MCVLGFGQWLKHEANSNSCHNNLMFVLFFCHSKTSKIYIDIYIKYLKTLPLLILLWMFGGFFKRKSKLYIFRFQSIITSEESKGTIYR